LRILLDECVHAGVRAAFPGHSVRTVSEAGWRSAKDRSLAQLAEREFDVFVTIDRTLEHQIGPHTFSVGFVVIRVPSNTLAAYLPSFPQILEAAITVRKGEIIHVDARHRA
jgi:hypothetical protein